MGVPGHRLDAMFNPKTVVVVGDKGPNYMWLQNNMPFKEKGGNLYSVQLDAKEIEGIEKLGIQNFTSMADVPELIDYALVAVPRQVSPFILKDLIAVGANGAAFFTSGFAETGEELGIKLQNTLVDMAKPANFNLVGPNCMGLYLPKVGVRFNNDAPIADDGKIGFLSQSGTHGIMFSLVAGANGMHLSRCASFGNAVVLDVSDYVDYLMHDDETEVIGMYVEGARDGRRFFETLREACKRKAGCRLEEVARRARAHGRRCHTPGSLASDQAVWGGDDAPVRGHRHRQSRRNDRRHEGAYARKASGWARRGTAHFKTGGQSVSITDAFAKQGFDVARFTDKTYAELESFFNIIGGSFQNPLDMGGTVQGKTETLQRILSIVEADENIDAIVMELSAMFAARQWKAKPETLTDMLDTRRRTRKRAGSRSSP
ncbi:MAG: CoA-binding protein [Dehalococcoidia bacterium]